MVPKPAILLGRLEFGNDEQIEAIKLFQEVRDEGNRATDSKTYCKATFFLNGKHRFEIIARNKTKAENLACKIHDIDIKDWTFNEVLYNLHERGSKTKE